MWHNCHNCHNCHNSIAIIWLKVRGSIACTWLSIFTIFMKYNCHKCEKCHNCHSCHGRCVTFFTSQRWPTVSGLTGWKEAILSGKQSKEAERALNFAHNCAHSLASESVVKSLGNFLKSFLKTIQRLFSGCEGCTFVQDFFCTHTITHPTTWNLLWLKVEKWNWWIIWGFICLRITLGLAPDFNWSRVTLLNCNGDYQISESGAWSRYTWMAGRNSGSNACWSVSDGGSPPVVLSSTGLLPAVLRELNIQSCILNVSSRMVDWNSGRYRVPVYM